MRLLLAAGAKPNVADIRESPSAILIEELEKEGAIVSWHDPLVKSWKKSNSVDLVDNSFDITVVAMLHDSMDESKILKSANYVFDCTGKTSAKNKL